MKTNRDHYENTKPITKSMVKSSTDKAVLITFQQKEMWIPKSLFHKFHLPDWYLIKNNLQEMFINP